MSIKVLQGGKISLNKESPGIHSVQVGLGWETAFFDGAEFDLDAEVFMLDKNNKVPSDEYFVFYKNRKSEDGSVEHTGDNRYGGMIDEFGKKIDDETIYVELDRVPEEVEKLVFTVSIYKADIRRQNFGMIKKAYIRIIDTSTLEEICRFDLSENGNTETAIIIGEIFRSDGEWRFSAVGKGFSGGLRSLALHFGVDVA